MKKFINCNITCIHKIIMTDKVVKKKIMKNKKKYKKKYVNRIKL